MIDTNNSIIFKVLGSGSCVPRRERSSPANLLKFKNCKYLIDCGSGTLHQLIKAHEDYKELTGVIFSHFHPDHTADFIPLIQALSYTPGYNRQVPLQVIGPEGLKKFTETLLDLYEFQPRGFGLEIIEMGNTKINLPDGLSIETIKGNHTDSSIIIKVTSQEQKTVVYSGDTDYDEAIAAFAKNADLLVLECSFPQKIGKHLTPEEAGRLAQMANPAKLLLTHIYPSIDEFEIKPQSRVKEFFMKQVILAQDFTEVIV